MLWVCIGLVHQYYFALYSMTVIHDIQLEMAK